jgi:transcriptional regulator with XRE-family HTH domain
MRITAKRCLIPLLLEKRGLTQQHLVDTTGLSKSTISAYCTFRRKTMSLPNALIISEVLRCDPRDLYEWDRG